MLRAYREITRDVARVTGAPLVQVLVLRDVAGGPRVAEVAAFDGPAVQNAGARARAGELLARDTGQVGAEALLADASAFRTVNACDPALGALVAPGPEGAWSVLYRLGPLPGAHPMLRILLTSPPVPAALPPLDAAARLAAARLQSERLRRELSSREAAYRLFQEGAGDGIFIADAVSGRVLEVNETFAGLAGQDRDALCEQELGQILVHPSLSSSALLAHLGSQRVVREPDARLRRGRGEPIPVALTVTRFELEGRPVLHATVRDVTQERRALEELRQAKDVLTALHLAAAHLMVETDEDAMLGALARELGRLGFQCGVLAPALDGGSGLRWRYLSFSAPVRRSIDEALGRPLGQVRVDPIAVPLVRRCLLENRTVHTELGRATVQALLGNPEPRQLRVLGRIMGIRRLVFAPLRREGRATAVLVVAAAKLRRTDPEAIDAFALQASIAMEKARLFGALREERARLESEVERRTAELTQAVAALEEADRQKDNFLANVSHELRTPLVTVLGYTDLLLEGKLGELTARQRTALQVVSTSGRRLKAFIDELLEFSRHELTKMAYRFAACQLSEILTNAVIALAPRFAERGLRVRVRVARGTPRVWADRERLVQVVVNLLQNAERYSPEGAVIRVTAARGAPGFVEVAVTDHGAGIAPEHVDHIFQRLYQVRDDQAPSAKGGALGIGLAIVKSIVEAHGGAVRVRSRVGRGTTFRFSLTVAPAEEQPRTAG